MFDDSFIIFALSRNQSQAKNHLAQFHPAITAEKLSQISG